MNILTDTFPETITIDGQAYQINTDFRMCLKTILAFEDDELTGYEKQAILLSNLFVTVPHDTKEAMIKAVEFFNGGKSNKPVDEDDEPSPRLYSFSKDANFIFAAFRQTHGIDLQKAQLHWLEFLALFMDLGSETTFCSLVSLRKRVKTGKASKEERQAAREMGEMFDIPEPDTRTLDEKEKELEFLRLIGK
jgi:hypothetical protein